MSERQVLIFGVTFVLGLVALQLMRRNPSLASSIGTAYSGATSAIDELPPLITGGKTYTTWPAWSTPPFNPANQGIEWVT